MSQKYFTRNKGLELPPKTIQNTLVSIHFINQYIQTMKKLKLLLQILQLRVIIIQLLIKQKLLKQNVTVPNLNKPLRRIVHHGGGDLDFEQVNIYHRRKWGFESSLGYYCGYQLFIDFDGVLYRARRDNEEGAHTVGNISHYYNKTSAAVCLQGNMEKRSPTDAQIKTLKEVLDKDIKNGLEITMHKDFSPTLCPGKNLEDWLNDYLK